MFDNFLFEFLKNLKYIFGTFLQRITENSVEIIFWIGIAKKFFENLNGNLIMKCKYVPNEEKQVDFIANEFYEYISKNNVHRKFLLNSLLDIYFKQYILC